MITDPKAIEFSNEKARRMADVLQEAYVSAKAFLTEWKADSDKMAKMFTDDDAVVKDGAEGSVNPVHDGREIITSTMIHDIVKACQAYVDIHEQDAKIMASIDMVQVNGDKTRFEK